MAHRAYLVSGVSKRWLKTENRSQTWCFIFKLLLSVFCHLISVI
jgi:hypothetical protein